MNTGCLIQNGTVLDGSGGKPMRVNVRVRGATIAELGALTPLPGETVIDATGLLVTPGLVDLHVHVFTGMGQWSVAPEEIGLRSGVTTMLDAGTSGALTFPAFHRLVIERAREDVFALLNISIIGCLQGHPAVEPFMGELNDIRYAHVPSAVACLKKYSDRLVGMKVRLTKGLANNSLKNELAGFHGAIDAATQTGTPLMVHHSSSAIPVAEFLDTMRAGDIMTHLYHPHANPPFVKKDRRPTSALLRARERGVLFDVGHGTGAFAWEIAEPACQEYGFWPDTIGTDLHQFNIHGSVYDMPTTMSKLLHLGMPLPQLIRASTHAAAQAMRLGDRFGLLLAGRQADITLLKIEKGKFKLDDVQGETRVARQRFVPVGVVKRGVYHPCQNQPAVERVHAAILNPWFPSDRQHSKK